MALRLHPFTSVYEVYAWVDFILDINKQVEHIEFSLFPVTFFHAVMHEIHPDPALILLSSNM